MSRPDYAGAMRLLDRYVLRELLTPLGYALGGFLVFWISWDLFNELQEMQERKLHLPDVLEYVAAMTPEFLATILPIALLLALLFALTHHARHQELTAMRAAGVSLWRICAPYFLVGLVAGAAVFTLNEYVVPRSTDWAREILQRYVQKPDDFSMRRQFHGFVNVPARRVWKFDEFRPAAAELIAPEVIQTLPDGSQWVLRAARAVWTNGQWTFYHAQEFVQANERSPFVPRPETNVLTLPAFRETPRQITVEMKISAYESLGKHKADISIADILSHLQFTGDGAGARGDSGWLLTELHTRLAAPWTCLVVVLMAIPFGAASGRRNLFAGVAGSLFICFAFFVVQKVAYALGAGGHLPGWLAAWLPNLIFGLAGLWLTARVR
ncbi:MAG TPA: LptF/LptG family permease [Verrucomicrobiae bacterium]|nr:LptF/LptG family permease [Verrucomicrobiae bacterium]